MDEIDFEAEFAKLTKDLGEAPEAISIADLSVFTEVLAETGMHVSRFLTILLCSEGEVIQIPKELLSIIPALAIGCEELTNILHAYTCDDEDDDDNEDDQVD